MNNTAVSIIIPTYNRKNSLVYCIDSINKQNFPKDSFELIVVDDGSNDGTVEFISEYLKKVQFRNIVISQTRKGPGIARNNGVQKAIGNIVALTEDDIVLDENWLSSGMKYLSTNKEVDAIEGITKYIGTEKPMRRFEHSYRIGFLPSNMMLRKTVFNQLGGYSGKYYDKRLNIYFREDIEFGFRFIEAGFKIVLAEDMIVCHPIEHKTIKDVYQHNKRYYFDPLLYREHPVLFCKTIELKQVGPLSIKRPMHYISVISIIFLGFGILFEKIFLIFYLIAIFIFCYRYKIKNPVNFVKILPLPFYHIWYFIKGCIAYKTFRPIV